MIENCRSCILLTDSSKFGRKTFASVAPLSVVNAVVTDVGLDPVYHGALTEMGITVYVVPRAGS